MKIYDPSTKIVSTPGIAKDSRRLISSAIASGDATLDFTGLGDARFRYYRLILFRLLPDTDNDFLGFQFSSDNGSSWITSGYAWGNQYFEPLTLQSNSSTSDSQITVTDNAASISVSSEFTEGGCNGFFDVYNMADGSAGTNSVSKIV